MIVLDTSGLLAAYDRRQHTHRQVLDVLEKEAGTLLLSPFVLAELGYLLATRVSPQAAEAALQDVANGVYELIPFSAADTARALAVIRKCPALEIGIADASCVTIAGDQRTTRVLTLDERRFRTVRPLYGEAFTVLPADA